MPIKFLIFMSLGLVAVVLLHTSIIHLVRLAREYRKLRREYLAWKKRNGVWP